MRFKTSRKPPPYLNSKDQRRLLGMVGLLALVLIAVQVASNPDFWAWMFPPEAAETDDQGSDERAKKDQEEIDFDVEFDDELPLPPGAFRSQPEADIPASNNGPPAGEDGTGSQQVDPHIDAGLLAPVRDNTLGIRREEADVYYKLLAKARDIPLSELERIAADDVAFRVLMIDSDEFRGELITVQGELRRLLPFPAGENEHGLEQLYEAWLFTADSGNNPYRIVCTSLPEGIPQGEQIQETVRVRVTGYFFKREGYASHGGLHTAPLLLANQIRWLRPQPAPGSTAAGQGAGRLVPYVIGFVVLVAAGLSFTVWRFSASDRAFHRHHLKRIREAPTGAIDALRGIETTDPHEALRALSEADSPTDTNELSSDSSHVPDEHSEDSRPPLI